MAYIQNQDLLIMLEKAAEAIMDNPVITPYGPNGFKARGVLRNAKPYSLRLGFTADREGGIQIMLGVDPFYKLYARKEKRVGSIVLPDYSKANEDYGLLPITRHIYTLLTEERTFTVAPPKDFQGTDKFDELLEWTVENAETEAEKVKRYFSEIGLVR